MGCVQVVDGHVLGSCVQRSLARAMVTPGVLGPHKWTVEGAWWAVEGAMWAVAVAMGAVVVATMGVYERPSVLPPGPAAGAGGGQ